MVLFPIFRMFLKKLARALTSIFKIGICQSWLFESHITRDGRTTHTADAGGTGTQQLICTRMAAHPAKSPTQSAQF